MIWVLITLQFSGLFITFHFTALMKMFFYFNFEQACWNDFTLYFDTHCFPAEKCFSVFLFFVIAPFPLILNAVKSPISVGRFQQQLQVC